MELNLSQSRMKRIALLMVGYLGLVYVFEHTPLLTFLHLTSNRDAILFIGWSLLLLLVFFKCPKLHGLNKTRNQAKVKIWALNAAVTYIVVFLLGGFIIGFGKSPYSHKVDAIVRNLFTIGVAIVGREYIRQYLIYTFCKKNQKKSILWIIGIMTLTSVRSLGTTDMESVKTLVIYLAEVFLPELCHNILASYLVLYGGAISSIIYLAVIEVFTLCFPILPNLNWLGKGVIGILVPSFATLIISELNGKVTKVAKVYRENEESVWSWIPTIVIAVCIIWFTVGVFPIYPSVIATGSMMPLIKPGDVILINKVNEASIKELKVGDIMQFKRNDILITHRIVEIVEEEGQMVYRTKGDNNSVEDRELVKPEDIKGVWAYTIPKIGWPTLIFKSNDPNVLDQVEF